MTNLYLEMKRKHEKDFGEFPIMYAFNKEQFHKGMLKLGLEITDTDKVYKTAAGGFYKKEDSQQLKDLLDNSSKEMEDAIKADTTGNGFIFSMFDYELSNHEYGYTMDIADTLSALNFTLEEINKSEPLKNGLQYAMLSQREEE